MNLIFQFDEKEYVLPFTRPKGGKWYSLSMDVMIRDGCLYVQNVQSVARNGKDDVIPVGKLEVVK